MIYNPNHVQSIKYHIKHDVTKPIPLNNNTVDIVQSEDVMEHIEYNFYKYYYVLNYLLLSVD